MKLVSLVILLLLLSSNFWLKFGTPTDSYQAYLNENAKDNVTVDSFIARYINELDTEAFVKLAGEKVYSNTVISTIYKEAGYAPLWQNTRNRQELETIIGNAFFDGLNPKDYHQEVITNYNSLANVYKKRKPSHVAMADVLMTDAILSYAHHLTHGKVNQHELSINWDYSLRPTVANKRFDLSHALKTNQLQAGIDSIRSHLTIYAKFKQLLAQYDSIQKAGGSIPLIKYPGQSLQKGDTLAEVTILKQRLIASAYHIDSSNNVFDDELEAALMDFQSLNGMPPDGIAGRKTYKALNISLQERIDILRANLERVRWINNEYPYEFILINIASYQLQLIKDNEVTFQCRVVVGKEHNPTPVFSSYIRYIVFNPNWHVPYSIASKEILPKLKTDSFYLQNRNMILMQGSAVINPSKVDFSQFTSSNFPYSIIQEPGPANALGKVKFILPNTYSVYLHDTPSKSLFKRIDRAFSHGCIRLEKPLQLAELLLKEQGYDQDAIEDIVESKNPLTIVLSKGMPTMIIYMTCNEDLENGKAIFYNDIYGLDKVLLNQLNKSR